MTKCVRIVSATEVSLSGNRVSVHTSVCAGDIAHVSSANGRTEYWGILKTCESAARYEWTIEPFTTDELPRLIAERLAHVDMEAYTESLFQPIIDAAISQTP